MVVKTEKVPSRSAIMKRRFASMPKLRWYCNMCQKQCRDYSGFRYHLMSDTHQRQLLIGLQMIADFNARNRDCGM